MYNKMKKINALYVFLLILLGIFIYKYLKNVEGYEIRNCNDICALQSKINIENCNNYPNDNPYMKCKNNNGVLVRPTCKRTNTNKCFYYE